MEIKKFTSDEQIALFGEKFDALYNKIDNEGYFREMADRIYIIQNNIELFLQEHPVATTYKTMYEALEEAQRNLSLAYKMIDNLNDHWLIENPIRKNWKELFDEDAKKQ